LNGFHHIRQVFAVAALAVLAAVPAARAATNPVIEALLKGDCNAAVQSANEASGQLDPIALFVAGRMADEGLCVEQDTTMAARYFARAALLGHVEARYEQAAAIGMGEQGDQSYEKAGEVCRTAGADPDKKLSDYALGYSCTLRALAGRSLRLALPTDALPRPTPPAKIEIRPDSRRISVVSLPPVNRESEAATGSRIRKPKVNLEEMIEDSWKSAVATAPQPDRSLLVGQAVQLPIDVDTTFEAGAGRLKMSELNEDHPTRRLLSGDVQNVGGKVGH